MEPFRPQLQHKSPEPDLPPPYAFEPRAAQGLPPPLISGGFSNAHHFVVNNPTLYDTTHNMHYHMGADTLQLMTPFILEGAEFDSFERDPPPRCHPGTRQDIMNAVLTWRNNNDRKRRLLWLNGSAGVGKSAVIQTLAEAEAEAGPGEGQLGATLFVSRPNKRADPNRVLGTIAYQLAVKDPAYRDYLTGQMAADPRLLGKTMAEQFRKLISKPFGELMLWKDASAWSVYIDGLDECIGEEAQCRLIELISAFTTQYPEAPLVWIISSRPESHLQNLFSRDDVLPTYHEVTIPVNSDAACRDVERYLRVELTKIKDGHPDLIPPTSLWPTETQFLEIARVASGLFVFATTVVLFIGAASTGESDPITQLHRVLAVIRQAKAAFNLEENPLAPLDLLYHQIMSSIPPATLRLTKQILGFAIFDAIAATGFVEVANVLGLSQHTMYNALARLASVINIPKPEDAVSSTITILHASFTDYLKDPKRSGEFCVNVVEFHTAVWRCFFRILRQVNESSNTYAADLSWKHPKWGDPETFYMVQHARTHWPRMVLTAHNKFRMYTRTLKISVSVSELLEVFDQIQFNRLEKYASAIISDHLLNFILWIRYYSPNEIRTRLFTYTAEGQISDCSRVINRITKDRFSYEVVWWPRESYVKLNLVGLWGKPPPHEWHGQFRPDAQILGTTDELTVKLRAEGTKKVKAVVLGGWFAVVEERELAEDESVRLYILRLSERIQSR